MENSSGDLNKGGLATFNITNFLPIAVESMDEGFALFKQENQSDVSTFKYDLVWCNKKFDVMFETRGPKMPKCFSYKIFRDFETASKEWSLF